MTILRLLGPQGIAGLAVAVILGLLLGAAKLDASHWKKQSARFEHLYRGESAAHAGTVAAVRAAAERARAADKANAARVRSDQRAISERTRNEFESRLADARARFGRVHPPAPAAAAGGACRKPQLPGLSTAPACADQAAVEDRLPAAAPLSGADALIATEQAIQLDELIKWVRAQARVEVEGDADRPER